MKGQPIFHESMTDIEIVDECGGEFLKVTQRNFDKECGSISINPNEWKMLKGAIDEMIKECRDVND